MEIMSVHWLLCFDRVSDQTRHIIPHQVGVFFIFTENEH